MRIIRVSNNGRFLSGLSKAAIATTLVGSLVGCATLQQQKVTKEQSTKFEEKFNGQKNVIKTEEDATLSLNNKTVSKNIDWSSNVRILASNAQINGKRTYQNDLMNTLKNPEVETLEEADAVLHKDGFKLGNLEKYRSLLKLDSAPSKELHIFDKSENNGKNRFILVISEGKEDSSFKPVRTDFENEVDETIKSLKEIYGIAESNILRVSTTPRYNKDAFAQGISMLSDKFNNAEDKSKIEVLIILNGHGNTKVILPGDANEKGKAEGFIFNKGLLSETDVKEIINSELKNYKTDVIVDTNTAAAWKN